MVELLLAIAIFAIVVSANFALAMNAYRGRANDRVRLEAGLAIKDTINGVYSYKTNNWSEVLAGLEDSNYGEESKRLDLVNNKFQLNSGGWKNDRINFSMYIKKANRTEGDINPSLDGGDPDTVKITIIANWTDIFGISQEISEDYFLSNWASDRWSETTNAEFLDYAVGSAPPVLDRAKIANDSVSLGNEVVYANTDWCNLVENTTVKHIDTETDIVSKLASKREQTNLGYRVYEPEASFPPLSPEAVSPPALSTITLNNTNPSICNQSSGVPILECESLVKFYKSLGGENWSNKSGWDTITTGSSPTSPCTWFGLTCVNGHITSISLDNNALSGSIPREIGNLTELENFQINHSSKNNQLTGSIPPEVGLLTKLETFQLTNATVSGRIPDTMGNLTSLTQLNISSTNVTGRLPSAIGRLTSLVGLDLHNNRFVCHIPPEITLISPSSLNLGDNYFVSTRYSAITNKISGSTGAFRLPPDWIEDNAYLDCAIAPAESNIALLQSTTTTDRFREITIPNSTFPPSASLSLIDDGTDNSGGSWNSKAYQFTNDVVGIAYNSIYNKMSTGEAFTISLWVRPDASNSVDLSRFLDFSDGTLGWYLSYGTGANKNKVNFTHAGSDTISLLSPSNLTVGTWAHIAVVMEGGEGTMTARMYINGSEVATDTYTGLSPSANPSQILRIGNNPNMDKGIDATVDDIRFYNRILTIKEINDTRYFEADRKDSGLVGYWRLNHPTNILNQTVYDYSYLTNHGTLGISISNTTNDPIGVEGQVQYRINDIFYYKEKIFFATTNPAKSILVYDKYSETPWQWIELNQAGSNYDTQAILIEGETAYALHSSYLFEFNPETYVINGEPINLNVGNTGIQNPVSLNISNGKAYVAGLDVSRNLLMLDIASRQIDFVKNIILDTYL